MRGAQYRRAVDAKRDSAGSTSVPLAFGNIVSIFGCEKAHRMFFLAERGISSGVFADQIDPERTNPDLPQIVQREELGYGASTLFIQKTVGTACALLDSGTHLPEGFDREQAFLIALELAQDLGSLADTISELQESEAGVRKRIEAGTVDRDKLPRTQNLRGRSNQAIGHLASARVLITRLAQMFYPKTDAKGGWSQQLSASLEAALSADDPALPNLLSSIEFLRELVDYRNALEHPDATKGITFRDYDMQPDGTWVAPTIEVKDSRSPVSRCDLVQFLQVRAERLADTFEQFLGTMCDRNVRDFAGVTETWVDQLPDGQFEKGSRLVWRSRFKPGMEPEPAS